MIDNTSYQHIGVVRAGNGYQSDLHEFQLRPNDTALVTVYDAVRCDLTAIGGPPRKRRRRHAVPGNRPRHRARALRVALPRPRAAVELLLLRHTATADSPFDAFHINAVDVSRDGGFLVDARNTWAVYDVDPRSGQVRWELGGKHDSFKLGPGAATAWQHDAREQPNGAITFFDNGSSPRVHPASRAIEVAVDPANRTATLVRSYSHPTPLVADSQGNVQALEDGDWVIGWGQAGYLSEVEPSGHLLFDAHLPSGWESYRTYVLPWSAQPAVPPTVAVRRSSHGGLVAYASWNGATGVASWRVLGGPLRDGAEAARERRSGWLRDGHRAPRERRRAVPGGAGA